jgi:hypothetical protein
MCLCGQPVLNNFSTNSTVLSKFFMTTSLCGHMFQFLVIKNTQMFTMLTSDMRGTQSTFYKISCCSVWWKDNKDIIILFKVPVGGGNFSAHHAFRTALGSTQPPIQWVPTVLSLGLKRPEREANHSPSSADVKNAWSYTSLCFNCAPRHEGIFGEWMYSSTDFLRRH